MKELTVKLRPACLQVEAGKELDNTERDQERARLIREYMRNKQE
jgi:protein-arginine kinase